MRGEREKERHTIGSSCQSSSSCWSTHLASNPPKVLTARKRERTVQTNTQIPGLAWGQVCLFELKCLYGMAQGQQFHALRWTEEGRVFKNQEERKREKQMARKIELSLRDTRRDAIKRQAIKSSFMLMWVFVLSKQQATGHFVSYLVSI